MSIAKDLKPATLTFILTGTGPLAADDARLAVVAAIAADGHHRQSQTVYQFALQQGASREAVRSAILLAAGFAGLARLETALSALAAAEAEIARPSDPLAAIMSAPAPAAGGASGGGAAAEPVGSLEVGEWAQAGNRLFAAVHGPAAPKVSERLAGLAPELPVWTRAVYGGALELPALSMRTRVLLGVAALVPLEAPPLLRRFVDALGGQGVDAEQAWVLFDLVSRLFHDGPAMRSARAVLEETLGKRADDGAEAPGGDPYRWD